MVDVACEPYAVPGKLLAFYNDSENSFAICVAIRIGKHLCAVFVSEVTYCTLQHLSHLPALAINGHICTPKCVLQSN